MEYKIEIKESFEKKYLTIKLKDNSKIDEVRTFLTMLQSVNHVNLTHNNRENLTLYSTDFFSIDETADEVKVQLDSFFSGKKIVNPIINKNSIDIISDISFEQIVEAINDFGLSLEKYKNLYDKFDEEGFRDYFLPHLNLISQSHTATGETFNKIGRTDILIQNQNGINVFLAECKLWNGKSELKKALDQLFDRYTTWRDEKLAIIVFNKNMQNFSDLIIKAKSAIESHGKFISKVKERKSSSIQYKFQHPEDGSKTLLLELILFNCK